MAIYFKELSPNLAFNLKVKELRYIALIVFYQKKKKKNSQLIVSIIIFSQYFFSIDFATRKSVGITPHCLYRDSLTLSKFKRII